MLTPLWKYKFKLINLIKRFWKYEKPHNPFLEAITAGIKETFIETGYKAGLIDET